MGSEIQDQLGSADGNSSLRTAVAIAFIRLGGVSLLWMLGDGAAQLPLAAGSIFALLAWIGSPLLAIATAFPWSRTRKRSRLEKAGAVARLVFGLIGMAALALLTDVGILLAGHSYWIDRAFTARTDAESRRCLRVVLGSTQYGRDLVANALAGLPPGERRRELEVAFGESKRSSNCPPRATVRQVRIRRVGVSPSKPPARARVDGLGARWEAARTVI